MGKNLFEKEKMTGIKYGEKKIGKNWSLTEKWGQNTMTWERKWEKIGKNREKQGKTQWRKIGEEKMGTKITRKSGGKNNDENLEKMRRIEKSGENAMTKNRQESISQKLRKASR